MSPGPRSDRLALVGAASQVGQELKEQLAAAGYPGKRIELLELDEQVGLLTDYGDEARVVLQAARESLAAFRLAAFCGDPESTRRFAPAFVDGGGVAVDCTGAFAADDTARLAGTPRPEGPCVIAVPHAGTLLLAGLAAALGLEAATVTLLLPASERHASGPEAMARQAAQLLNYGEPGDTEESIFGRRTAFDVWPDDQGVAERIADELSRLGLPCPRLCALRASVFHVLSASLWSPNGDADALRAALTAAGVRVQAPDDPRGAIDSPVRAAGRDGLRVTGLRGAGDGAWLWALLDNYRATAAAALHELSLHLQPPEDSPGG